MAELRYFQKREFDCFCCGENQMNDYFLGQLDEARHQAGVPFIVSSGYRCQKHDKSVGGAGNHTTGMAADIKVNWSAERFKILKALLDVGFERIGVAGSFIHVDMVPDKPRPAIWLYR